MAHKLAFKMNWVKWRERMLIPMPDANVLLNILMDEYNWILFLVPGGQMYKEGIGGMNPKLYSSIEKIQHLYTKLARPHKSFHLL